jgi:hypothetical protein
VDREVLDAQIGARAGLGGDRGDARARHARGVERGLEGSGRGALLARGLISRRRPAVSYGCRMVAKAPKSATRADLEALPPTWRGEIIDGELYAFPRPAAIHSLVLVRGP